MKILEEESGQGSAELILLFGGVIVIAIIALIAYRNYLDGLGDEVNGSELNKTTTAIQDLEDLF
ncbi:MAG TPA: class III signal peptide-containing protein [Methanobacterium sp.]|nr:MAG: class III signal peptide-containing protein [Methanobacterium sp.]HOI71783.1 class III signal peptide-containing protein [Methanobacterium sp.]